MKHSLNNIVVVYDYAADFWTFGKEAYHATIGEFDLGSTVGSGATIIDAVIDLLAQIGE